MDNFDGSVSRFHTLVVGSVPVQIDDRTTVNLAVELTCEETTDAVPSHVPHPHGGQQRDPVGPSRFTPVLVEILTGDGPVPASAAQLRELAGDLMRAAVLLEGIAPDGLS